MDAKIHISSFAQKKASSYGLTGWVSNTSDGKVEGEAQGDEESIQKYLKDLNSGPSPAHVVKVEKSEQDAKAGESSFEVK
ncbi:hypothetical protein MMC08_006941 [Hypocenomyce scalaris]|nr:hypothetical protein [Hypocenomyce scalaris]